MEPIDLTGRMKKLNIHNPCPYPRRRPLRAKGTQEAAVQTWGQIKKLTQEAQANLQQGGRATDPASMFLMMLALISNQVNFASLEKVYWAYVPDPPLIRAVRWEDQAVPVYVSNPDILVPPSIGLLPPQWAGEFNYSRKAASPPICFTTEAIKSFGCVIQNWEFKTTHSLLNEVEDYESFKSEKWGMLLKGFPNKKLWANKSIRPCKVPACGITDHVNKDYPSWRQCRYGMAVKHPIEGTSLAIYDWSKPNPAGHSHYELIETPGGFVETLRQSMDEFNLMYGSW